MSSRNDIQAIEFALEVAWEKHAASRVVTEPAIEALARVKAALAEVDRLRAENERMRKAFGEFDAAISSAQRQQHNYEWWDDAQWDPINAARSKFYGK